MQPGELAIFKDILQQGYDPLARYIAQASMSESSRREFASLALFELFSESFLTLANIVKNQDMYQVYDHIRGLLDSEKMISLESRGKTPSRKPMFSMPFSQRKNFELLPGEHSGCVTTIVVNQGTAQNPNYLKGELMVWGGLRIPTEQDHHDTHGRYGPRSRSAGRTHEAKTEEIAMRPTHLNLEIGNPHRQGDEASIIQARIVFDNQKSKIFLASCSGQGMNIRVRPEMRRSDRTFGPYYQQFVNALGVFTTAMVRNIPTRS